MIENINISKVEFRARNGWLQLIKKIIIGLYSTV